MSLKNIFLILSLLLSQFLASAVGQKCDPVLDGAIINIAFECLNDSTALVVDSSRTDMQGWQYSFDSDEDGVTSGRIGGGDFEIYGLAFKETVDNIYLVINGNLPSNGYPSHRAKDGVIGWGDIFINLDSNKDFEKAHKTQALYAIRFTLDNESQTDAIGLYSNVDALGVSTQNAGFRNWNHYSRYLKKRKVTPILGDFGANQTYYAGHLNLNVINDSKFGGFIKLMTPKELKKSGFKAEVFSGVVTIGIKLKKRTIIDECGVIGGDGSSCTDCNGVACGTAKLDQCDICGGDGTSCLDCEGTPFGVKVLDQCGVCGGDGNSCLDCAGTVFGTAKVDTCGVCGGDGTSCLDCEGTPFGEETLDQCGVCGGDGTSCLDCEGVVFGTKKVDQCGVCGGNGKSCIDCKEVPFGTAKIDDCGICGGDNSSCIDCLGVANGAAILDRCGVCNGDGTSCIECEETSITGDLYALDGSAVAQRHIILRMLKDLGKRKRTKKKLRKQRETIVSRVEQLYFKNWSITWEIPSTINSCQETPFCVVEVHSNLIDAYLENAAALRDLGAKVSSLYHKKKKQNRRGKAMQRRVEKLYNEALRLADMVPTETASCS